MDKSNVQQTMEKYVNEEMVIKNYNDIKDVMIKYISPEDKIDEQSFTPLVGLIKSKMNQNPHVLIALASALCLAGLSGVVKDDRTKNYLIQISRNIVSKV